VFQIYENEVMDLFEWLCQTQAQAKVRRGKKQGEKGKEEEFASSLSLINYVVKLFA
jgi:hypothetical protein